ncbi:MAG: M42 family metallopeptidase [Candidatus Flexifilum sp.]|jgi:putative aminopeptidase FrvX
MSTALNPIPLQPMVDFLVGLLNTPSPTGYHTEAINYCETAFSALPLPGLMVMRTRKGALLITLPGQRSDAPRALTAHIDTLGLMVRDIKPNGRLRTTQIGGYMWPAVEFETVTIRTFDDRRYRGTVLPTNPSTHVNREIATAQRTEALMEVRIDARTTSAGETRALGIEVGDFIFLDPRVEVLPNGFIRSRHLDDKAGVACIYGALRALPADFVPAQTTYILIANYEEVGHGGSAGLPPVDELLVIDMAAIGEGQASSEYTCSLCVKDSSGPYHDEMNTLLRRLAQQHGIPLVIDTYPNYSSDGSAYWRAGGTGVVGLIGPGVDASHAYERTHIDALRDTAALIGHYLLRS